MIKSVEIVEYLLNVMRNKKESSFIISIGMEFDKLKNQTK